MNINRHNYETFFLLYADRELSAAERLMVEEFAAAHPDLQADLQLLEQTRLQSDERLDPAFLAGLKRPEPVITEEQLLLYADKELDVPGRREVEAVLAVDPALEKELRLLQKARFEPDLSLAFPDKSILYRRQPGGRVFFLGNFTRRMAAAAAVVLLLSTGWWLLRPANNTGNLAQQTDVKTPAQPVPGAGTVPPADYQHNAMGPDPAEEANGPQPVTSARLASLRDNNTSPETPAAIVKETPETTSQQKYPDVMVAVETPLQPEKNQELRNKTEPSPVLAITNTAASTGYTVYTDEGDDDEDEGLLTEEQQRRSGLKGFLKKARRTIERRTGIQAGDATVRFAVFAVNTH